MKNGIGRGEEFSATEISQVLARYRRSGLGAVPFAQEHGIPPGWLPAMTHSQVRELLPRQWRQAPRGGGAGVP